MCTYSMIADDFIRRHPQPWSPSEPPNVMPWSPGIWPGMIPLPNPPMVPPTVSIEEFEQLKKEVQALKVLLKAAKKFDAETGQPDCEMEEKVELLRKIAKLVGVNIDEVLTKGP